MIDPQDHHALLELADAYCDGRCDAEQAARLNELLLHDEEARCVFLRYVDINAELSISDNAMALAAASERLKFMLEQSGGEVADFIELLQDASLEAGQFVRKVTQLDRLGASLDADEEAEGDSFLGALSALEIDAADNAHIVDITDELHRRDSRQKRRDVVQREPWHAPREALRPVRYYVIPKPVFYGAVAAIVLAIGLLARPWIDPSPSGPATPYDSARKPVGQIITQVRARWADADRPAQGLTPLYDEELTLLEGFVRLQFNSGAQVIVQAPATFRATSMSHLWLDNGNVVGYCADLAEPFIIETPAVRVMDIGTEFGVSALPGEGTLVQVFEGEVQVSASATAGSESYSESLRLNANQAARSDTDGTLVTVQTPGPRFTRTLQNRNSIGIPGVQLDLADVVGGGTGFGGGTFGHAINRATGTVQDVITKPRVFSSDYTAVSDHPFVDGVFVPNNAAGVTIVTSSAQSFEEGPGTSGHSYGTVRAGGQEIFYIGTNGTNGTNARMIDAVLGGINYSDPKAGHAAIAMHANLGITFDLDAIRAAMPGVEITGFSTVAGISETAGLVAEFAVGAEALKDNHAEIWVVVDGLLQFHRLAPLAGPSFTLDVPIEAHDRFLTLVVTEGRDQGNYADFVVFGDPLLKLKTKAPADQSAPEARDATATAPVPFH